MPSFSVEVPHQLGKQGARSRLENFLQTIGEKYKGQIGHLEGSWQDDTLRFNLTTFGIRIDGSIAVEEDRVVLQGELPFSALMFKGKISGGIQEALAKALAPASA